MTTCPGTVLTVVHRGGRKRTKHFTPRRAPRDAYTRRRYDDLGVL